MSAAVPVRSDPGYSLHRHRGKNGHAAAKKEKKGLFSFK